MNGLNPGKYTPSSPICTEPFSSKYTVQEDIGRGKFAVVRRCVNIKTGEVVAAKIIRKRRKGKSCREEILREVVMLELAMAHPRLVCLREVFETQSELILVTEYCSGGELFDECVIKESFMEDDVRRLLAQILEGLAFLHDNNIVHLDLKPQNILLTKPFPEGEVKICDLGFACLTNTGEDIRDIIGTPDYVAPEVLDYEPLNIQTDMWSLGVLTYVMLTACSPFAGDTQQETFCNITQIKLDFPEDLFGHINPLAEDFIKKLLVKRPRDRLTARQCFDHPWLKDLQNTMRLNVPISDHSEELAQDMVIPSNWHMSPDRRSSISVIDSSSIDTSPRVDGQNFLMDLSSSSKEYVAGNLSEDKDSISKTLSYIDIDRHSLDRSSTASFETCPESMDPGHGLDIIAVDCASGLDTSSTTFTESSSTTNGEAISKFASEIVQLATTAEPQLDSDVSTSEELENAGHYLVDMSQEGIEDISQNESALPSEFQPSLNTPDTVLEFQSNPATSDTTLEFQPNFVTPDTSSEFQSNPTTSDTTLEFQPDFITPDTSSEFQPDLSTSDTSSEFQPNLTTPDTTLEFQTALTTPTTSNISIVPTPRDSNRQANSKNRMSLEIPHKKAKCIEQGESPLNDEESDKVHSMPQLSNAEHTPVEPEQCKEQPGQACNGTEEYRNAV